MNKEELIRTVTSLRDKVVVMGRWATRGSAGIDVLTDDEKADLRVQVQEFISHAREQAEQLIEFIQRQ